MGKLTIKPGISLFIDMMNITNISLAIVNFDSGMLHIDSVDKVNNEYMVRKNFMIKVAELVAKFNINTIVMEQNRLFIDKIDRYPDPLVLRNVLLGFSIKTSLEDKYWDNIRLLEIPEQDWKNKVLNTRSKYAIDLYKAHILEKDISPEILKQVDENNYYRVLCFSESVMYNTLMHKKYQINKV